jgi:hypothetical protein
LKHPSIDKKKNLKSKEKKYSRNLTIFPG